LQLKKIGVIESSEIISRAAYHNNSTFRDDPLSGKLNWGHGGPSPKGAWPPAPLLPPPLMMMMRVQLQTAKRLMFLLNS